VNALGAVVKSAAGFAVPNPYIAIAAAAQRQDEGNGRRVGTPQAPEAGRTKQDDDESQGGNLLKLLGKKPDEENH